MDDQKRRMLFVNLAYWFGIAADGLWALGLFSPPIFGMMTGSPDFNPDLQTRYIMAMGGVLMTGWTFLLLWAVRKPLERRFIILLTAFPVVFGMLMISLVEFLHGNIFVIWVLIKCMVLIILMISSYMLAGRMIAGSQ